MSLICHISPIIVSMLKLDIQIWGGIPLELTSIVRPCYLFIHRNIMPWLAYLILGIQLCGVPGDFQNPFDLVT